MFLLHSPRLQALHALKRTPTATQDFEGLVASLSNEYADAKQLLWDKVIRKLHEKGEDILASNVMLMRQRGLALARLKKLCNPRGGMEQRSCDAALRNYSHLSRGEGLGRVPLSPDAPETLSDFLSAGGSDYARFAETMLRKLWDLHTDVSVRKTWTPPSPEVQYTFYLLKAGEPEHLENSVSRIIDLDFVNTGREMMLPVQIGGVEATVNLQHRIMHVDLFGRDLRMRRLEGKVSAMQLFMCTAIATMSHDVQMQGAVAADYMVTLEAADKGDGKLLDYYRGFGFKSGRQSYVMSARVPDLLGNCARF